MALSFLGTGLVQLAWRRFRKQHLTGMKAPAAWRVLPYVVWLLVTG
jgi:hypothetical protein